MEDGYIPPGMFNYAHSWSQGYDEYNVKDSIKWIKNWDNMWKEQQKKIDPDGLYSEASKKLSEYFAKEAAIQNDWLKSCLIELTDDLFVPFFEAYKKNPGVLHDIFKQYLEKFKIKVYNLGVSEQSKEHTSFILIFQGDEVKFGKLF